MTSGCWIRVARTLAAWTAAWLGLAALLGASAGAADGPARMNFQGLLLDAAGAPKNGTVTLAFALFDTPTGGSALWSETLAGVQVADGIYDVVLGASTPLTPDVFSDATRYLEVSIDGETLSPRRQLLAVPYAIRAETSGALAENGANCPAGQAALGVDASGAAESCIDPLESLGDDATPSLGGNLDANNMLVVNLGGISASSGQWTLNDTAQGDPAPANRATLRIRSSNVGGAAEFVAGHGANQGEFMVKFIEFAADETPNTERLQGYINKGGHVHFRTSLTVAGVINDHNSCDAVLPTGHLNDCRIRPAYWGSSAIPSASYMVGVWSDVEGPGILSRSNNTNPPSMPFMGMHSDGTPTFQVHHSGEVSIWDGDSHFGSFDMANLSASRTYLFPDRDGDVLLRSGVWNAAGSIPMSSDASGSAVTDSGLRVDTTSAGANYLALPSDTDDASELRFFEDASHPGENFISLRAARDTRNLAEDTSLQIVKLTRAAPAATRRSPVIGAVAIPSTLDTGASLCEQQYDAAATGVTASCLAGSAKGYDVVTALPFWIGSNYPNDNCTATVGAGVYFEAVCTVED